MFEEKLQNAAVLGASGKMGSGIALLLLQELALANARKAGNAAAAGTLTLIDMNEGSLKGLQTYLRTSLTKFAEKNAVALRAAYQKRADLVDNLEMVETFVDEAMLNVRCDVDVTAARRAKLVFEAIVEDLDVKVEVYKKVKAASTAAPYFFTNTSSIPISELDERAGLDHRIIGCHFYNPPAVQELIEVIAPKNTDKDLVALTSELVKRLRKKAVPSNDVAGFIGNGHFMRDLLFGLQLAKELTGTHKDHEALYMANRVSADFMIRPMGILQLIDYVGVDVCQLILKTMTRFLKKTDLRSDLLDRMLELKVKGGQNADGSQKDGFLKYEKGAPAAVYSLEARAYRPFLDGGFTKACDEALGALPAGHLPWKQLSGDREKDAKLKAYFKNLFAGKTSGAALAKRYLERSRAIAQELVDDGIAQRIEDVNQVLKSGFFHLYGPMNDFF